MISKGRIFISKWWILLISLLQKTLEYSLKSRVIPKEYSSIKITTEMHWAKVLKNIYTEVSIPNANAYRNVYKTLVSVYNYIQWHLIGDITITHTT